MKASTIAVSVLAAGFLCSCGPKGTPDPEPRPQTLDEYLAAMEATPPDDPTKVPMLLEFQKKNALKEMGGRATASGFKKSPDQTQEEYERWRDRGIAYFNAPFGTVEEREAWVAYVRAVERIPDPS